MGQLAVDCPSPSHHSNMAFITSAVTTRRSTHSNSLNSSCKPRTSFFQTAPRRSLAWTHAMASSPLPPLVAPSTSPSTLITATSAKPKILISGAPASGKGTQCELIVQKYRVVHISTGDMLRAAVKAQTPLGIEAKSYMDTGKLVPDQLVISMLKQRITQQDCLDRGWLLDGFPRTFVQAKALDEAGILPTSVLLLQVQDDVLIERVVGRRSDPVTGKIYHVKFSPSTDPDVSARLVQRSDDTEEKARVRLETYYKHSKSIQGHYASIIRQVDGNRPKDQVFLDLANEIDKSLQDEDRDYTSGGGSIGSTASSGTSTATAQQTTDSSEAMPVAEFVRRAEEAYERGVLLDQDVNWSGQAAADTPDSAGTSSYSDLAARFDLVLGDLFALLTFTYIGRAHHGSRSIDLEVLQTAAPFIVAWLLASPLLGAYTREATANVSSALKFFSRSWAISVPMGIGLRGVLTDHVPSAVFAVITLAFTFLIVGSWRVLYVKIRGEETDSARRGGIMDGFRMVTTLLRRW